jgi:hypothetical protein
MDNFQAPNLVGIIMQALESHITALVDKRFNERMAAIQIEIPNMDAINVAITEMIDEKVDEKVSDIHNEINDMIDEKISDHQSEYDHDEYDQCVRDVENAGLDDFEDKIRDVLRGSSFTINL